MTELPARAAPVFPHGWRELVNGSVEENFASIALGTLDSLIQPDFVPPIEHIQLLFYLTLYPEQHTVSPTRPLSILNHLLSVHSPSAFSQAIPCHPSNLSRNLRDGEPDWLEWDYKRSSMHRSVWRCMRGCKVDGAWAMLWQQETSSGMATGSRSRGQSEARSRGGKRVHRDEDESSEEEEGRTRKTVSERGWLLLEWLVEVWEVDRGKDASDPYSALFLRQIPRPYGDLQRSDASYVLDVVRCAYAEDKKSVETTDSQYASHRRRACAARLLGLLLDTTLAPKPPLHPQSLASSLLHLSRSLSLPALRALLRDLQQHQGDRQHWRVVAHLLALTIEDLAGVRHTKSEKRRRNMQLQSGRKTGRSNDPVVGDSAEDQDFEQGIPLDVPRVRYTYGELLKLPLGAGSNVKSEPDEATEDVKPWERLCCLKIELVAVLKLNAAYGAPALAKVAAEVRGDIAWWKAIDEAVQAGAEVDDAASVGTMQLLLQNCIKASLPL
ncbi:hypothetical protein IAU60_003783 [Kwoniella sp. DSM 27419]